MAKPMSTLLSGIELPEEDIAELKPHVKRVCEEIRKDAPAIKKGFKEIEKDVLKTGKAIYDWLGKGDD